MNVNIQFDRYMVLLHAFDTFEGACEYMTLIIKVRECKVLPLIKAWNGGVVTAKWLTKKTDKGWIAIRQCLIGGNEYDSI